MTVACDPVPDSIGRDERHEQMFLVRVGRCHFEHFQQCVAGQRLLLLPEKMLDDAPIAAEAEVAALPSEV